MPRVMVIGLDACPPAVLFDSLLPHLPAFRALAQRSMVGPLESSMPPITVPAWSSMVTGLDPGALGIYGFHDRRDYSYEGRRLASSLHVGAPTLWSLLSRAHKRCRVLGVPQTYPPKPVRGTLVAGPPLPEGARDFVYPVEAHAALMEWVPDYRVDVPEFRRANQAQAVAQVVAMTEARFRVAERWVQAADWDFFMMVEIGLDRMQHMIWDDAILDAALAPQTGALFDYYRQLDRHLAKLLSLLRADDVVFVVSDHGAQRLWGNFALNEWLVAEGYLVLNQPRAPGVVSPLLPAEVDWTRTRAWGDGGYVGRIYLNLLGRESQGIVSEADAPSLLAELRRKLGALLGPDDQRLPVQTLAPHEVYREVNGVPPDLMVLVAELRFRTLGTLGHGQLFVAKNDQGADAANHAPHGVLILQDGQGARPAPTHATLLDIAPTVLHRLGMTPPGSMHGQIL